MNNSIGIIVPVYNVKEQYVRECIASLTSQTYENIRIYLVDDRSQDWCGKVCDEIGKLDDRITVIHHEVNKGLPAARNTGLGMCAEDWVTFVDGDDWIDTGMCRNFIDYLQTSGNSPDVFIYSGYRSYPDHEEGNRNTEHLEFRSRESIDKLQIDALTTFVIGNPDNIVPFDSAWGKFFKRSYLNSNGLIFRDLPFREDGMFFQEVVEYTENVVYSPELMYHYRMCGNSMVNVYRKNAPAEMEKYLGMLCDFAKRRNKGREYDRAIYGAAFFAMQIVINNYYYNPKCPLKGSQKKKECEEYFEKEYFKGVFDAFPPDTIKRNHRIKMILIKHGMYGGVRILRDIYLKLNKRVCFE